MATPGLQITIPPPCGVPWEEMTPANGGRYCATCTRTIVDFSQATDEELLAFFTNPSNRNSCGRFRESQLARELVKSPRSRTILPAAWQRMAAALISLQAFTATAFAQKGKKPVPTSAAPKKQTMCSIF